METISRGTMLRGFGYCVEDEDMGAFSFSPRLLQSLNNIVDSDNKILPYIIDSLFGVCEDVFAGNRERTALGIEEWELIVPIGDLLHVIGNDAVTEAEDIAQKLHRWMIVASETVIGVGMVSKMADKKDSWLIHSQPLWHLQATIYRDNDGKVCRQPDGFILIPSEALRSLARHRYRINQAKGE